MPIKIQSDLPARDILDNENIFVMDEYRALHQDMRPLQICILNLMPVKQDTELHLLRSLSNTPLQVDVTFMKMNSHVSMNTSITHLNKFYNTFDELKENKYDGLIITGAPVEQLDFEEVDYWPELCSIMEWSRTNVHSTLHICWGAQAGIYFHYGVPKYPLPEKMFGIFSHKLMKKFSPLVRGFDDEFLAPHSRHTEVHAVSNGTPAMAKSSPRADSTRGILMNVPVLQKRGEDSALAGWADSDIMPPFLVPQNATIIG